MINQKSGSERRISIDPRSASSLALEVICKGHVIGTATGFVVQKEQRHYLITNWHVVSGTDPNTNEILSKECPFPPDKLRISHHAASRLGSWVTRSQPLCDGAGKPLWLEHPQGKKVDVVALLINELDADIALYPIDLSLEDTIILIQPAMPVCIIGFPLGLASAGKFPIWKTGHIASDPDLDYDERPIFLIDATTRSGMSGSPVIFRSIGGYVAPDGNYVLSSRKIDRFLGVYSGRANEFSEIGKVWKPHVITEILAQTTRPSAGK